MDVHNDTVLGKGVFNRCHLCYHWAPHGKVYVIDVRCGNPGDVSTVGALVKDCDHHFIVFGLGSLKEWSTVVQAEDRDSSNETLDVLFDPILIYLIHQLVNTQQFQSTDVEVKCGMTRPGPLVCILTLLRFG
jgi:hypothetical protein